MNYQDNRADRISRFVNVTTINAGMIDLQNKTQNLITDNNKTLINSPSTFDYKTNRNLQIDFVWFRWVLRLIHKSFTETPAAVAAAAAAHKQTPKYTLRSPMRSLFCILLSCFVLLLLLLFLPTHTCFKFLMFEPNINLSRKHGLSRWPVCVYLLGVLSILFELIWCARAPYCLCSLDCVRPAHIYYLLCTKIQKKSAFRLLFTKESVQRERAPEMKLHTTRHNTRTYNRTTKNDATTTQYNRWRTKIQWRNNAPYCVVYLGGLY